MFTADAELVSFPAVARDGTVYASGVDGKLYAVAPGGAPRWAFAAGPAPCRAPTIDDEGTVYLSCANVLWAVNADGTPRWSWLYAGNGYLGTPVIGGDGVLYLGTDGRLLAIGVGFPAE
jgi:outer membrane protein assembly factor BamB